MKTSMRIAVSMTMLALFGTTLPASAADCIWAPMGSYAPGANSAVCSTSVDSRVTGFLGAYNITSISAGSVTFRGATRVVAELRIALSPSNDRCTAGQNNRLAWSLDWVKASSGAIRHEIHATGSTRCQLSASPNSAFSGEVLWRHRCQVGVQCPGGVTGF